MKGISSVIATLLLVVITIGLAGTAYFFVSNLAERSTSSNFQVLDISGNQIIISNLGTKPITQNDLKIVIDNNPVSSFTIEGGSIDAGKTGIVTFQASLSEGMHRIIVINKGVSQATSFYYSASSALTTTMWTTTFVATSTTLPTTSTTFVATSTTLPTTSTTSCIGYTIKCSSCYSSCVGACIPCPENPTLCKCVGGVPI